MTPQELALECPPETSKYVVISSRDFEVGVDDTLVVDDGAANAADKTVIASPIKGRRGRKRKNPLPVDPDESCANVNNTTEINTTALSTMANVDETVNNGADNHEDVDVEKCDDREDDDENKEENDDDDEVIGNSKKKRKF